MPLRIIRQTTFPAAPLSMVAEEQAILSDVDAEIIPVECVTADELLQYAPRADGIITSAVPVTAAVLDAMPACRGIVTASVGYDHVDLRAAATRGIPVAYTPDFCTRDVATHTMALLLAVARKVVRLDDALRAGRWDRTMLYPTPPIYGETLGLLSFGRIARQVAARALAFEMRVLAYSPNLTPAVAAEFGVEQVSFDDLLARSDYLSVHTPLTPLTRHLLGDRELALMKPTAFVLNTGRGAVIDEQALIRALQEGRIAGAGLDVFEHEPLAPDSPLLQLDNVVLTPHSAAYSEESIRAKSRLAAAEMHRILRGERPLNPLV